MQCTKVKDIAKELEINIAKVGAMKKSAWKRLVKYKMKTKIEDRLKREMEGKTKSRTIKEDKWKIYVIKCKLAILKYISARNTFFCN